MKRRKGYKVIPQMFDVKPVDDAGGVDVEKIKSICKIIRLKSENKNEKKLERRKAIAVMLAKEEQEKQTAARARNQVRNIINRGARSYQLGKPVRREREIPSLIRSTYRPKKKIFFQDVSKKRETALEEFFGSVAERNKFQKSPYQSGMPIGKEILFESKKNRSGKPFSSSGDVPFIEKVKNDFEKRNEIKINISNQPDLFQNKNEAVAESGWSKDYLGLKKSDPTDIPEVAKNPFVSDYDPAIFENYFGVLGKQNPEAQENLFVKNEKKSDFVDSEFHDSLFTKKEVPKMPDSSRYEEILQSNPVKETEIEKTTVLNDITEKLSSAGSSMAKKQRRKKRKSNKPGIAGHLFSNYRKISKKAIQKTGLKLGMRFPVFQPALSFAVMLCFVSVFILSGLFVSKGMKFKDQVMVKGKNAVGYIAQARTDLENQDFRSAGEKLDNAKKEFEQAEKEIVFLGGDALDIFSSLPYLSKISTGKNIIEAGKLLTEAGQEMAQAAMIFSQIDNPLGGIGSEQDEVKNKESQSLTDVMLQANEHIGRAGNLLSDAKNSLDKVNMEDVPAEYAGKFEAIKGAIPLVINTISGFEQNYQIFLDILGHNGSRKYLFLFQNNQEMRASGGFIGSYGILDINEGHIKNLFIDGIFNPDGQLSERVVPPKPIQKVSAVWTMHDSNWFPNFPTSAEKAAWFYEKTGGPTVDGVIALTPTVMQKMLEITGPIEMPQYETTVDKDNFVEKTQYEVEVDYDKEQNKPKQFIADLAPKILDKVFSVRNPQQISNVFKVLAGSLKEKHILIYSNNFNLQTIIAQQGWSGEILQTSKDYLMVVNSNINGYKTDGVVEETISHRAEIQPDGSVIDTVKIKRVHNGGDSQYDWWNKVNANYMRVYVPKGSRLISARGQTREFNQPPIDYDQLGFRRDAQVQREELSMEIDEETGTRIYEEENKTVFANWVYVSPKESVEIEYQYLLPFRIDLSKNKDRTDGYSLLAQKQSGSQGSSFEGEVVFPENMEIIWKYPESLELNSTQFRFHGQLQQDRFYGAVFREKQ